MAFETFANDDAPYSLQRASDELLMGVAKPSALRAAIQRGELEAEFLAGKFVVTPKAIKAWREMCREKARERVYICAGEPELTVYGSSSTDRKKSLLASAKATVNALRKPLQTTS